MLSGAYQHMPTGHATEPCAETALMYFVTENALW